MVPLLAILSGLLFGTSYIPFPPWAAFFALVPLWFCWLREKSLVRIFWTGWITQFVFTAVGFNWVAYTVHEFGHLPWILAIGTLFLFCALANIWVPFVGIAWAYFCRRLQLREAAKIWSLVIFMCVAERVMPMIFDWHMGYVWLWWRLPGFHLADIIGFIGLSNIGWVLHGLFLHAAVQWQAQRPWGKAAVTPLLLILLINLVGFWHGRESVHNDARLKVLMVQPNIGNQEKLQAEQGPAFRDTVINQFVSLTAKGLEASGPVDFAVWPETAFPELIEDPQLSFGYARKLKTRIIQMHSKLITGGYSRQIGTGRITNSFFILDEHGAWLVPPYHKTVLLAFGEYMPFGDWLPFLRQLIPEVADFGRGQGPTVLTIGGLKIGAQICYEGLFDWFARRQAQQGAQVLVNLTNDSWYGTWEQPFQHGFMTLARAVEVRRPLVRSTNTGLSTVALASGDIMELSPLHAEWFHLYEVPYATQPPETLFMTWGYWLIPTLLFLAIAVLVWRGRKEL